ELELARLADRHGLDLLRLGQVLVGGAVSVVRQRHPLARRALARGRAAFQRVAVYVEAPQWLPGEELVRQLEVPADDLPYAVLLGHREEDPDVVEQRARWTGEVVPIGGETLDGRLTGLEDALVGMAIRPRRVRLEDVPRQLAI